MAGEVAAQWRRLAQALAARRNDPPLIADPARRADPRGELFGFVSPDGALRIAAAVLEDRMDDALAVTAASDEVRAWRAVALRRAGRFPEARRAFRELGARPEHSRLLTQALNVLRCGNGGFRWATESADHLATLGRWDPIWFVDACGAAQEGVIGRESAAMLEQIQRAELQLMLDAGAAG